MALPLTQTAPLPNATVLCTRWPPVIPSAVLAAGPAVAMFVGVAAGLYPALRASRLAPTEALRSL